MGLAARSVLPEPTRSRSLQEAGAYKKPEKVLSVQVAVRLTQGEKSALEERAVAEGLTVSKYIHKVLFP